MKERHLIEDGYTVVESTGDKSHAQSVANSFRRRQYQAKIKLDELSGYYRVWIRRKERY